MKFCSIAHGGESTPRAALLMANGDYLDLTHGAAEVVQPSEPLGWYDLEGESLPAASALAHALGSDEGEATLVRVRAAVVSAADARVLAPVPRPGKFICIGLNYRDHAIESGMDIPESPVVFSKFTSAVVGPNDNVVIPPGSKEVDYEAELGVVIGRRAHRVSVEEAGNHVLGYMNINDVSARDFQFADGQWQRGKSCDTFAPCGEYIATPDELADPHTLRIQLRLNGKTLQDSNTDQLIFGIPQLVSFLSQSTTLEPGDVIATGTPPGVGFARKPPIYIGAGDVMEVEIDGLGVLRSPVVGEDGA